MEKNDLPIKEYETIINRIKTFYAPKRLQRETLIFLANARYTSSDESLETAFDFKSLKNSFRKLDTDNSGTLHIDELKTAFAESGMKKEELDEMFTRIDFNLDGELNYTEFLAASLNKQKVCSKSNLALAFNNFDIDNSGSITAENLVEAFKRQGKKIELDEANKMVGEAAPDGKSLDLKSFNLLMQEIMKVEMEAGEINPKKKK